MDAEIAAWTRTVGHVEAMRRLQAAGVPAGAVMDEPNLYADEQINDRVTSSRRCGTRTPASTATQA